MTPLMQFFKEVKEGNAEVLELKKSETGTYIVESFLLLNGFELGETLESDTVTYTMYHHELYPTLTIKEMFNVDVYSVAVE